MSEVSSGWNDIEIIPGARRARRVFEAATRVGNLARFLPESPLAPHGDHLPKRVRESGAAVMLDQFLDEQPQLPFPGQVGGAIAVPRHSATIE